MATLTHIITDDELNDAWGNADFGSLDKREVIRNSLLKYACGYSTGHTAFCICQELGLVNAKEKLTDKGKHYLFTAYSGGKSV